MKPVFVILGAEGHMGYELAEDAHRRGYEVVAVTGPRHQWQGVGMHLPWHGEVEEPWALALEGAQVVVQLPKYHAPEKPRATANHQRDSLWTEHQRQQSRSIAQAIRACKVIPTLWLHVSSTQWYRDTPCGVESEWLGEPGIEAHNREIQQTEEDFFAAAVPAVTRKINVRNALILCDSQLHELAPALDVDQSFREHCGWIHPKDWLGALHFLIENSLLDGVFNLCAPSAMPLTLLGDWFEHSQTDTVLNDSIHWPPHAAPARLIDEGFEFVHPSAHHAHQTAFPQPSFPAVRQLAGSRC